TLGITFTPDGAHGVGHRRAHAAARERQVVDGDAQVVVTTHLLVHALAIAAGGIGEDEYFGFLLFGREGDHVGLVQRLDARLAHTFELLLAEVDHAADGDGLEHVTGEDVAAVERAVQALDAIDFHFHQGRYRGFLDLGHGGAIEGTADTLAQLVILVRREHRGGQQGGNQGRGKKPGKTHIQLRVRTHRSSPCWPFWFRRAGGSGRACHAGAGALHACKSVWSTGPSGPATTAPPSDQRRG